MKVLLIVLVAVIALILLFVLLGAAILKLATRLCDSQATPPYGKAIKIVLLTGAAMFLVTPLLAYLPGAVVIGNAGVPNLPPILQGARFSPLTPVIAIAIEAGILTAMLPTRFVKGVLIALMRLVVGWGIMLALAIGGLAVFAAWSR